MEVKITNPICTYIVDKRKSSYVTIVFNWKFCKANLCALVSLAFMFHLIKFKCNLYHKLYTHFGYATGWSPDQFLWKCLSIAVVGYYISPYICGMYWNCNGTRNCLDSAEPIALQTQKCDLKFYDWAPKCEQKKYEIAHFTNLFELLFYLKERTAP